ncbi:MAG TPA: DNA primase [Kiritimatiellia bacterium]|nr:DNA primase [Kiritimatiellia bacterium]
MAGMVSKDVIDQIRNALDIADVIGSYVQLKRAGNSIKALCPFHKEKTPSFHVNSARQAFHCFGCGVGGDVFKFVMLYDHVDFPTALRMLASRAGVHLQLEETHSGPKDGPGKDEIFAANEEASKRYQKELLQSPEAAAAREYLKKRALNTEVCKEWGIGWAPEGYGFLADAAGPRGGPKMKALEAAGLVATSEKGSLYDRFRGRVMFTIRDELGRAVGFSGRVLKTEDKTVGKYVNTPETPVFRKSRILFALDKAKREILDRHAALLVEGQIDCIRCHLGGFPNAVASQGTAFTSEHAMLLKRYTDHVVIVLDADAAGQKAALRSAELLIAEGLAVSLAALPSGEDPDSLILKQGSAAFAAVLENVKTPMGFLLGLLQAQEDLRTQEGLLRATRAALELAEHAAGAVQTEQMLREAAAGLGIGYDALRRDLRAAVRRKLRPTPAPDEAVAVALPAARPVAELELAMLLGVRNDPELAGLVRRWVPYELITDPACRSIVHALAEEEGDLMAALGDAGEECQALAAQIVNAPQKVLGTEEDLGVAKAAQDLIVGLWRRRLDGRRAELTRRLKERTGDERRETTRELAELLLDLGKLKLGWAQAHPIIDLYLQKFCAT